MVKRGRPKLAENEKKSYDYISTITLKLTEEQKGKIKVVARTENKSVSQLLRDFINTKISAYDWVE